MRFEDQLRILDWSFNLQLDGPIRREGDLLAFYDVEDCESKLFALIDVLLRSN